MSRLGTGHYRNRLIASLATLACAAGIGGGLYPLAASGHAQTNGAIDQALAQMRRVAARSQSHGHYLPASVIVQGLERRGVAAMAVNPLELALLKDYASGGADPTPGLAVSGDATHLRLDRFVGDWDVHLDARPGQTPETWAPTVSTKRDYLRVLEVLGGLAAVICLLLLSWAESSYRAARRALRPATAR